MYMDLLDPFFKTFLLVFMAEFGDKSQLVCMTLSARYKAWPVMVGSVIAFALLNLIAVLFGASLSSVLPESWIYGIVGVLFLLFGVQSFRAEDDEDDTGELKVGRHLLISVFTLIFFAELGDKTQLSVAGMSAVQPPLIVWFAGTMALALTTLLGVWFGRVVLQRLSLAWVHKGAGLLFILFSMIAFWQLYTVLISSN